MIGGIWKMALVERICPACRGDKGFASWTGAVAACLHCNGTGTVVAPDDDTARRMIESVLREREPIGDPNDSGGLARVPSVPERPFLKPKGRC